MCFGGKSKSTPAPTQAPQQPLAKEIPAEPLSPTAKTDTSSPVTPSTDTRTTSSNTGLAIPM